MPSATNRPRRAAGLAAVTTAVFLVLATLPVPARQEQPTAQKPTFRAQITLVQVDVFVTDEKGQFVPDLTVNDFELLEDGKLQSVSNFTLVNLPVTAVASTPPAAAPPRPDVETNAARTEPRVYVLMLDDVQTAMTDVMRTRDAAMRFIDAYLEPGDIAAVMFGSGSGDVSAAFTSDRARLRKAVGTFVPTGLAAARLTTDRMRVVAQYLAGVPGRRKACIYFGPGFSTAKRPIPKGPPLASVDDPGMGQTPNVGILEEVQYRDLVAAANRANVSVYSIDVRGIRALANLLSAVVPGRSYSEADEATKAATNAGVAKEGLDTQTDGRLSLAADTGGVGALNADVDRFFRQVQIESSSYYMLGYHTAETEKAVLRKIAVRLRRPGLTVRARRQFWWAGSSTPVSSPLFNAKAVPPALLPALQYPLRQSEIRFAAVATAFKGSDRPGASLSVTIEVDGRDLDSTGQGALDVAVLSVNRGGEVKGSDVRRLDLALDAASLVRMQKNGLRVQTRVPVPAGSSAIRIALADPSGRVGSLWMDVEVPDFSGSSLTMSGLALTHRDAALSPTANTDQELRTRLGAPASTRRQFTSRDSLFWLADVYPSSDSLSDLKATSTIVDADGAVVFCREQPLTRDAGTAMHVTGSADLSELVPGAYTLRVEVQDLGGAAVRRDAPITVIATEGGA